MAIYWPTARFKGRTFKLCVLTRWDFNFCVRSFPLREFRGVSRTTIMYPTEAEACDSALNAHIAVKCKAMAAFGLKWLWRSALRRRFSCSECNPFEFEICSLTDIYDVVLRNKYLIENDSYVPIRIWERKLWKPKAIDSERETVAVLRGRGKDKRNCFYFDVIEFQLTASHPFLMLSVRVWVLWRGCPFLSEKRVSGAEWHLQGVVK